MIYKAPSIYKFGGGAGGYKDGGALVDGDFIKVENNTISSYNNVNRNPVNFYLELKDGEIANSVVELTTAVNATINVYILKNGLYYLMGNVGGNTVTAGEQYNLNIVGNSYALEKITSSGNDPKLAYINGKIYGLKKIGSQYYTTEDYEGSFKTDFHNLQLYSLIPANTAGKCTFFYQGNNKGTFYRIYPYTDYSGSQCKSFEDEFNASVYPWRLPKSTDSIFAYNCSTLSSWLNFNTFGFVRNNASGSNIGLNAYENQTQWCYWVIDGGVPKIVYNYDDNSIPSMISWNDCFVRVRLCMDI